MSAVEEIMAALPVEQVAQRTGSTPDDVRTTAAAVLPALLGGLQANAGSSSGAGSIVEALGQHDDDLLTGGADLSAIDEGDGRVIASHVFGSQQDEVATRLGGLPGVGGPGAGGALVGKLIPILAPMVLSWLANRVLRGGGPPGSSGSSGGGGLGDVIGDVLGGRSNESSSPGSGPSAGGTASLPGGGGAAPGTLQDMLREVLGGATAGAPPSGTAGSGTTAAPRGGIDAGSIIQDVLGGILGGGRR